mmetsp:Transcript_40575/g.67827  ORF Transcript_40575/g.67827 Transcript_40575/m.67827 type:complete len:147 (-) Transcript_40575:727-1167(-)
MAFVMPIFAGSSSLRPSGIPRVCITSSGSARKTFVSNGKKTIYARKEFGVFAEDKAFTFPTAEEHARAEIAKARVKFFPEEDSEVAAAWNAQFESLLHIIQDLEKDARRIRALETLQAKVKEFETHTGKNLLDELLKERRAEAQCG